MGVSYYIINEDEIIKQKSEIETMMEVGETVERIRIDDIDDISVNERCTVISSTSNKIEIPHNNGSESFEIKNTLERT